MENKEKFKKGEIVKARENFLPLYLEGDLFKIIKINKDKRLMPLEARRIKNGKIYGFDEEEFEKLKTCVKDL